MNTDYREQARQSADIEYEIEAGNYEKADAFLESGYSMLFVLAHEPYWGTPGDEFCPCGDGNSIAKAKAYVEAYRLKLKVDEQEESVGGL